MHSCDEWNFDFVDKFFDRGGQELLAFGLLFSPYTGSDFARGKRAAVPMTFSIRHNLRKLFRVCGAVAVPYEIDVTFSWLDAAIFAGYEIPFGY